VAKQKKTSAAEYKPVRNGGSGRPKKVHAMWVGPLACSSHQAAPWGRWGLMCLRPGESNAVVGNIDCATQKVDRQTHDMSIIWWCCSVHSCLQSRLLMVQGNAGCFLCSSGSCCYRQRKLSHWLEVWYDKKLELAARAYTTEANTWWWISLIIHYYELLLLVFIRLCFAYWQSLREFMKIL